MPHRNITSVCPCTENCDFLLRNGCAPALAQRYIDWCKDFVVYHLHRPPEEMGALEVEQYLQHVREQRRPRRRGGPRGSDNAVSGRAWQAQSLEPRLLDRVRALLRVRHYALRTEECYVQWIMRFILFHNKRHPAEMGSGELQEFLISTASSIPTAWAPKKSSGF